MEDFIISNGRRINNYWTRLSKISWFVSGEQINYLSKPKAEANNWPARHWQIILSFDAFFFFPSIGRESTTWPANNCLKIMVCSCVVPSKCVLLQIILCSCVIGTTFWREKWQIASLSCQEVIKIWKQTCWSNDKTIIELGYHNIFNNYWTRLGKISWFVSGEQINIFAEAEGWGK